MILPALMLALQTAVEPALTHDGGVCAGISWITLAPGETVSVDRGPDFYVLRFHGQRGPDDKAWGVYSGGFAQVTGTGAPLLTRDDVTVRRADEGGTFGGYLAQKGSGQNHFFGSPFVDAPADRTFFDRVDFGPKGQMLCAKGR